VQQLRQDAGTGAGVVTAEADTALKKPARGEEFAWLLGKPSQWDEIAARVVQVLRYKGHGVFAVSYSLVGGLGDVEECQIMWDQRLGRWVRYG
jgi:hypothetical protein